MPQQPNPLIQRFPAGLLPLLSIKSADTPETISQTVIPVLDLLPFYLSDRLETLTSTVVGTSAVGNATIQVPAGEYWWLWAVNAIASNISAPGALIKLACGVQTPDGSGPVLNSMLAPQASVATELFYLSATPPGGLLLRPGCFIFAGTIVDPGAPTLDLTVRAMFARLSPNA